MADLAQFHMHLHVGDVAPKAPYVARLMSCRRSGWYRRMDFLSFMTVVEGRGRLGSMSPRSVPRFTELVPGDVVLLRPRDLTALEGWDGERVTVAYVAFPTAAWRVFAGLAGLDPRWATAASPPRVSLALDDPDGLPAFRTAIERFNSTPSVYDLMRFWIGLVPRIVPQAIEATVGPRGAPSWLAGGIEAMRAEVNLRGGVHRLRELAGVSAGYLSAVTRRHYGCTPTALVAEMRLDRAAELLRTTDAKVTEIAQRTGYASLVHLSARFRDAFGVSPRAYRRAVAILPTDNALPSSEFLSLVRR